MAAVAAVVVASDGAHRQTAMANYVLEQSVILTDGNVLSV